MSIGIFNSEDQSLIKLASNSITADETIETLNDIKVSVATDKASVAADKATVSADKADIVSMKSEIANTKTTIDETAQTVSENANSVQQEKIAIDKTKTDIDKKYTEISNTASKLNTEYNNLTSNYYTKEATNSLISSTTKPKYSVVNELPTSDISTDIIYLKSTNTTSTDGVYEMYTYQDSNWVKIGTSNPDLADYYTKELANSTFATKTEINNTNTEVSELREDLNELQDTYNVITGKNLYNQNKTEVGYLNEDNTIVQNDAWRLSEYIPITNNKIIGSFTINGARSMVPPYFLMEYDGNKQKIKYTSSPNSRVTLDENTKYIRFSVSIKYLEFMLEYGTNMTTYEPYSEKRVLKSECLPKSEDFSDKLKAPIYTSFEFNVNNGKVLTVLGSVYDADDTRYGVTDLIDISECETIRVRGSANYSSAIYCFFASDGTSVVGYKQAKSGSDITKFSGYVEVPQGAKYIRVAQLDKGISYIAVVKYISSYRVKTNIWDDYTWVAFGDSLTEDNNSATERYHDYIADETGIKVLNYGVGGTGYAKDNSSGGKNFMERVQTLSDVDFDIITFFGSGNDLSSNLPTGTYLDTTVETKAGCINITLDNLYAIKPFAKVGIITPTPWQSVTPWGDDQSMTNYSNVLVEIAKHRGIPYLDLYHCSNMHPDDANFRNEFYSRDGGNGVHPDEKGHLRIHSQIREFLAKLI